MHLPKVEAEPDDSDDLTPARRRRARRLLTPVHPEERDVVLERLARLTSPSIDFFLFSFLASVIFGGALALDQPALLVLGLLLSPLLAPVLGVSLGITIGSGRFFSSSLIGFLIGSSFTFLLGGLAGIIAQAWLPEPDTLFVLARFATRLSWINALVLAVGVVLTAAYLTRSVHRARLPNIALVYGLYLPLNAAGFGLVVSGFHLWPDGLLVFALHFALAAFLGAITLRVLGFKPPTLFGYTLGGVVALLSLVILLGISGIGIAFRGQIAIPTFTPTPLPTLTPTPVPPTATGTPAPPTLTPTWTITPSPTVTLTPSPILPTLTATPVLALVDVEGDSGGRIRSEPGGSTLGILKNGTLLQVLSDPVELNGIKWVHVITMDGSVEGWMVSSLLATATPAPNWTP